LSAEFAQETSELNAQHSQCLEGSPNEGSNGGTCSKSSCQALHTARDEAQRKGNEEVRVCRDRLGAYLAEKRREERQRADAEREADAERDKLRQERDKNEADRKNTNERTERDRRASEKKTDEDRQAAKDRADKSARDTEEKAARNTQERAEQERRTAEARRQAYRMVVVNTTNNMKSTWQQRIRSGVPEVMSDTSSFMKIVQGAFRGDGSRSLAEVVVAADTLAERAETAYAWITSPVQTFTDQVTADAIQLVKAQGDFQQNDARVHTIFRGVKKLNDIAHESNPFTKAMNAAVYEQLESHFQTMLGEVENLESAIGSFDYSSKKHADQPLANPFRGSTATLPKSPQGGGNPWRQPAEPVTQVEESRPVTGALPSRESTNPFHVGDSVIEVNPFTRPSQTSPAMADKTNKTPSSNASPAPQDRMVRYRDPATRELSTKRRSALPQSLSGDDLEQTKCSRDGLGIVTEECERRRKVGGARSGNTVK
jgi:hypothetical protein